MFKQRKAVKDVEEGNELRPKFNHEGLIPVVTTDFVTNKLLMHAYMNEEALKLTITKREAYYYSRTRKCLWHKGSTSGFVQKVEQILIDDDQDCIWLKVKVEGDASCHVGYNSCFYREVKLENGDIKLIFTEKEKVFDPDEVYGDSPNPTIL